MHQVICQQETVTYNLLLRELQYKYFVKASEKISKKKSPL